MEWGLVDACWCTNVKWDEYRAPKKGKKLEWINIERAIMDWLSFVPYNFNIIEFCTDISIATHLGMVGVIEIKPFCEDLVRTGLLKKISEMGQPIQQQQKRPCGPE